MTTMIVFGMFMALLFGGMMLALVMGYLSTEQIRAAGESERERGRVTAAESLAESPGFFAGPGRAKSGSLTPGSYDELIGRIESHLRDEQALVARFVNEPSLDNLYRQAAASPMVH